MALLTSFAKARVRQRVIGSASGITLIAITNLSATVPTTNTVSVPGAKVGDIVIITAQTPTTGVGLTAYVSAASTVTIIQQSLTAAVVGTVTATQAQLEVLRP